jgi:Fe-S oxidoreductase
VSTEFELGLRARVDDMIAACTRCGHCVEACPIAAPAGIAAPPADVIAGVLDILRGRDAPEASRAWATSCALSGACIQACDEAVNPRFLLAMARVAIARSLRPAHEQRRLGVENFRKLGRDVTVQSRMQLTAEMLGRLGQSRRAAAPDETPDFVFYTGCNVLKTPHMALLALDIMDALGVTYRVMGGPTHCCGVVQFRTGDTAVSGNMAESTLTKLAQAKSGVLAWCASCYVQFSEVTLPCYERTHGSRPFEMTPFMLFLRDRLDDLRPLLRTPIEMRVALHWHPGVAGVIEAATALLEAVPGITLVDLGQPAVGLMSNSLGALPAYKRELQRTELEAARTAQVDALVAVYHPDHRELCAHERDMPFRIVNLLEIVGAAMGIREEDHYKRLKKLQDADLILAECRDRLAGHGIDEEMARGAIRAMLDEQPLPLQGRA